VRVRLEASLELVGMLAWSSQSPGERARGATCSRTSTPGTSVPSYLFGPLPLPEFAGGGTLLPAVPV
jgi:hypothetical protein